MGAALALGSPVIVTEQYPKALGHTVPELQSIIADKPSVTVHEKTRFSMITPDVDARLTAVGVTAVVLFGAEVCACRLTSWGFYQLGFLLLLQQCVHTNMPCATASLEHIHSVHRQS